VAAATDDRVAVVALLASEAVVEAVCERIPARFGLDPRTDVMTLVPMRRGPVGLEVLNVELEQRLNPGNRPEGHAPEPLDVTACKFTLKSALREANRQIFAASRAPG